MDVEKESSCSKCSGTGVIKCKVCGGNGYVWSLRAFLFKMAEACGNCNCEGCQSCPDCREHKLLTVAT